MMRIGNQERIMTYLEALGRPANTLEIMSACLLDSRQVFKAARSLIAKGVLTKRLETVKIKGPHPHNSKLLVYQYPHNGKVPVCEKLTKVD